MSEIIFDSLDDINIISLKGQFLGGEETERLSDEIKKLSDKGELKLLINLEKVKYINSTVIGVFISAHSNFQRRGGMIVFFNQNDNLKNIFKITRLDKVFVFEKNYDKAISKVKNI